MKVILVGLLNLIAIQALAFDPSLELNKVFCNYWDDPNDNARLGIAFKYDPENQDFTEVKISKRMTDDDESWKEIYKNDEQFTVSPSTYAIGIDDVVIVIKRPIPGWNKAKGSNGTLEMRNTGESYDLICENIEK